MKIFRCQAQGDTVYVKAVDKADAERVLHHFMGDIPGNFLTWDEVKKLPKGEELINP